MGNRRKERPNAMKHGAFSAITILPGEDPEDFNRLHAALNAEWHPAGASEQDAVASIANAIWRKIRAQKFIKIQVLNNSFDSNHPAYDEVVCLQGLANMMDRKPETAFKDFASRALRPDKVTYLERKFPLSNFNSTSEWARAIVNEINKVLIPESLLLWTRNSTNPHAAEALGAMILSTASFTAGSGDLFDQDVSLAERLEAMIDRGIKRLIQIKAMKQMLAQTERLQVGRDQAKPTTRPSRKVDQGKRAAATTA
jgi:hypothetical protein